MMFHMISIIAAAAAAAKMAAVAEVATRPNIAADKIESSDVLNSRQKPYFLLFRKL